MINKTQKITILLLLSIGLFSACNHKPKPVDITFQPQVFRSADNGDNWCVTWAKDNLLYTSQCDGRGWSNKNGSSGDFMNNKIWKIDGGPDSASFNPQWIYEAPDYSRTAQQVIYGPIFSPDSTNRFPPQNKLDTWNWYSYGIISVDGSIYQFISHCAERKGFGWFDGTQIIHRPKGKKQWLRWNGTIANNNDKWLLNEGDNELFFFNEPDLAFSFITVAQYGKDYQLNKDGYLYFYSPEGKEKSNQLNMARVKKENILQREKWEFFQNLNENGSANWTNKIENRGLVHKFPEGWGFYSWSPSVIWNEQLGVFLMACAGTQPPGSGGVLENYMHYKTGGLMFLWADNPWGPWNQFYWNENWNAGDSVNRLYLPQLSPKWISKDGKDIFMIFSDAGRDFGKKNYRWNMQKIHVVMDGDN